MSKNLSIERKTEKFSFIYTLTIYRSENYQPYQNSQKSISRHSVPSSDRKELSPPSQNPQNLQKSSALSKTNPEQSNGSSLAVANPTTIANDWYELESDENYELDLFSLEAISEPNLESNTPQKKIAPAKLLLLASFGYFTLVAWWLFSYTTGRNFIPFLFSNRETIPKADVEFLDYMQRSLETIDRQVIANQKASPTAEENPTVVYVPVYTQAATNPITSYSPPPLPKAIPLPPPPPSEFSAIEPSVKIPSPPTPVESANIKIKETPKTSDTKVATAITTPKINSTLVGLVELGEASAALFKVNGITQRIWLGESLENTNWILESVTKEKATMTNQGKSRTLSIGESF
ncbi:hypothetical protein [Xenococcus sp. PCC 7305]|uniref:hypothetical protein n=1 Tax=Xenococcus sp. PCC 7305 TaxID=102125 RepID=UPI0002E67A3F|nr:hypothetical protein [Xenococcus sp. PCC 7305]